MDKIADKCTGCFACANVCPNDAIEIQYDDKGFYKAVIDDSKCIGCALCENVCPQKNDLDNSNYIESKTFAVIANDVIRSKCSSGGAFYLIASYVLRNGGVVYGATFDENLTLRHLKAENEKELEGLCKSKYVQSHIGSKIITDIKNELNAGKEVLFVGLPCQIAGIKRMISGHEKLFTIDLLCSGCQPPKYFKKYVVELEEYYGKKVKRIDFRDKRQGWHCGDITLEFIDGSEKILKNEVWFQGFLAHLYMSEACKECKYSEYPRQGDISIGDFWNIERIRPDLNDSKGTSLLSINSLKAEKFIEVMNTEAYKFEPIDYEFTKHSNWFTNGRNVNDKQIEFYKRLKYMSFRNSVKKTLGYKYDCGIVGCFTSVNYGAALTYYALYRAICDMSLKVLMIEKTNENPFPPLEEPIAFKINPYRRSDISRLYPDIDEMRDLNMLCKSFVVGSDQLWNWELFGHSWKVWTLDFVDSEHNKVAYATSFGENRLSIPDEMIETVGNKLKRFDHISVRETSGVSICKNCFGVDADKVLDPVYLCDKNVFVDLAGLSDFFYDKPYVFCYVIWPSESKIKLIKEVSHKLNMMPIIVPDSLGVDRWNNWKEEFKIIENAKVEDWLSLLINSNYVVSDSFHAYSLSLIFNKQVISIAYGDKGERMKSVQKEFGLPMTIDSSLPFPNLVNILEEKHICFDDFSEKLKKQRNKSLKWLQKALEA
jgi:coenzyme F420-reducing hydrogenase beta subunit